MDRSHAEDAFAAFLEAHDLDDDAQRLHDEDTADEREDDLLFAADGERRNAATERERACIAHEHLRGMRIEPEEAQTSSCERHRDDGKLIGKAVMRDAEVVGVLRVAADVTKAGVGQRGGERAARGEAVEAVGEVHGIRSPHDDEREHRDGEDTHVCDDRVFHEGNVQRPQRVAAVRRHKISKGEARDDSHAGLPDEFGASTDTFGVLLADFEVVVSEAEGSETECGEQDDPHHDVVPLRPQQRGENDGAEDQNASHGRRAGFFAVEFGELVHFLGGADGLPDLQGDQFADELVPKHQREHEGRDGGPARAEGVVFEEVEDFVERGVVADPVTVSEPFAQFVKPVHHTV